MVMSLMASTHKEGLKTSKVLTNTVCGLRKCALWTVFKAFAFEEQISSLALGAEVFVETPLALWSFAFWEKYV